jgi:hypothetical protein
MLGKAPLAPGTLKWHQARLGALGKAAVGPPAFSLNKARNFLPSRDSNVTKLPEMSALKL